MLTGILERFLMKWYQMHWAQKYWGKEARERYRRYLQSDAWKAKRKSILQAAGFRCRRCGAPAFVGTVIRQPW